jgi:hypothetical protein
MTMLTREDRKPWILVALIAIGGRATVVQVCRYLWQNHEMSCDALAIDSSLGSTKIRWAATKLRLSRSLLRQIDKAPRPGN